MMHLHAAVNGPIAIDKGWKHVRAEVVLDTFAGRLHEGDVDVTRNLRTGKLIQFTFNTARAASQMISAFIFMVLPLLWLLPRRPVVEEIDCRDLELGLHPPVHSMHGLDSGPGDQIQYLYATLCLFVNNCIYLQLFAHTRVFIDLTVAQSVFVG